MKESTGKALRGVEATSGVAGVRRALEAAELYGGYIGLDVHQETIAVGVAQCGRDAPRYDGEIRNRPKAVAKLIGKLTKRFGGERLLFVYEAGPCGYGLYRQLIASGHACEVVAPSLIPRKAGERVKTDRRDALSLARQARSGELTAVWVPDAEQEAIRDLTRAREDMKAIETKARQRLGAFLLRHGHVYEAGKSKWTQRVGWVKRSVTHQVAFFTHNRQSVLTACSFSTSACCAAFAKTRREHPFDLVAVVILPEHCSVALGWHLKDQGGHWPSFRPADTVIDGLRCAPPILPRCRCVFPGARSRVPGAAGSR